MLRVTSVCVGVAVSMLVAGSALAADVTLKYMSWEPSQVEIEADAVAAFEKEHNVTVEVRLCPPKNIGRGYLHSPPVATCRTRS